MRTTLNPVTAPAATRADRPTIRLHRLRRRSTLTTTLVAAALGIVSLAARSHAAEQPLRVDERGRGLLAADGAPFFYLADTAWELLHRADRDETIRYLDDRAAKGFTVIQTVALAELDGLRTPNAAGHVPLVELDPARPLTVDGPANDYWDHVDFAIDAANRRGLTVALLPTWGDKWNLKWGVGPVVFTPDNARAFGLWLGARYRDADVIWVLGGDRPIESDEQRAIVVAMAEGVEAGDGGRRLKTFHPSGGYGSSDFFINADWIDLRFRQNGHEVRYEERFAGTLRDYQLEPSKPIVDGEPLYEGHPIGFNAARNGYSTAADVRRPLYWNLLSGACGHAYGHHSVWQMWRPGRDPVNGPLMPWEQALDAPGAGQMQHGRTLMRLLAGWGLVPDESLLKPLPWAPDDSPIAARGAGRYRVLAARDAGGAGVVAYLPVGRPIRLDLSDLGAVGYAAWFNPRTGELTPIDAVDPSNDGVFDTPDTGELLDWVLIVAAEPLDAASRRARSP
ncbi:MAG: DUF4038 domain-containing protein [Planctomycetota bacterium]